MQMVPEVLDWVEFRAYRGPLQDSDALRLQEVCGDSGRVWTSIFQLESEVSVLLEVWHNNGPQHLGNVWLRSHSSSAARANIVESNWSQKLVEADSSPDHDAGASPSGEFADLDE